MPAAERNGASAEGLVVGAYRSLLGREPNAATIAAAAAEIRGRSWDAATMLLSIQTIEEAARAKVAAWYRSDLGRPAPIAELKLDSGVNFWARLLSRG